MILFVIRDHIEEETPARLLQEKVVKEMEKIWHELEKPPHLHLDTPLSDFFDVQFCTLPHMKLAKEQFAKEMKEFQSRFINPHDPAYLFASQYHGKKTVPMDGFAVYAQNIWQTIEAAKDLNLPSQRSMLATFRCDEV